MRLSLIIGLISITFLGGCTDREAQVILEEVFPGQTDVRIKASCSEAFGLAGSIALFELSSSEPVTLEDVGEPSLIEGHWSREISLMSFVEKHDLGEGTGLGRTILEGKACLKKHSNRADEILFADNPGLYFGASKKSIVIVLFDTPPNSGVIFMAGR